MSKAESLTRSGTVSFERLQQLTGYTRVGDVEKCLSRNRIFFFKGKDCVWTTEEIMSAAAGVSDVASTKSNRQEPII